MKPPAFKILSFSISRSGLWSLDKLYSFDMNYEYNPSGVVPQAEGEIGSVRELVPIFQKYGFAWGGNWKVPDGGHFEVVRIVKL